MNALTLLAPLLIALLQQIIPALGSLLVALIGNLTAKLGEDADATVEITYQIVRGVAENSSNDELPWQEKQAMARYALRQYSPDISDSMANALIELSVQRLKAEK